MTPWISCWSDDSDPERADRERDAYEDSLLEQEPPEDPDLCPACGGLPEAGCSVCRMAAVPAREEMAR
jgi:hypothetical protein